MPTAERKARLLDAKPSPSAAVGGHFPEVGAGSVATPIPAEIPAPLRRSGAFPINAAAKLLGVTIETFRRWESEGAITSRHDPITGGRAYYSADLQKIWILRADLAPKGAA